MDDLTQLDYDQLLERAAPFLHQRYNKHHGSDGKFSSGAGPGGPGGGGGAGDEGDDVGEPVEPAKIASKKAGSEYTARAIDDPDGTLATDATAGDPAHYVEVVENARDPIGEGTLYSPSDARVIAGEVDVVAGQARAATPTAPSRKSCCAAPCGLRERPGADCLGPGERSSHRCLSRCIRRPPGRRNPFPHDRRTRRIAGLGGWPTARSCRRTHIRFGPT